MDIIFEKTGQVQENLDYLFSITNSKYNDDIVLDEEDRTNKIKVMCKEPYASELFKLYKGEKISATKITKDLVVDEVYTVRPITVDMDNKLIIAEELFSKINVYIPFREYPENIEELTSGRRKELKVAITRKANGNVFWGSCKDFMYSIYLDEMKAMAETEKWFNVKIIDLVRGGYFALYKNSVKCFIPGSHAAANIINDFESFLGKEIPVVIDNYDQLSNIYIVSYKKYIESTLPERIHELRFNMKYTGRLTSKPTDYGMFVEFGSGYFTGLIHKTEFQNYEEIRKKYKIGDTVDFYIKNINVIPRENGLYTKFRIILTTDESKVDRDKKSWSDKKDKYESKTMDYFYDSDKEKVNILDNGDVVFSISVKYQDVKERLYNSKKILIKQIDVVNQSVIMDFC